MKKTTIREVKSSKDLHRFIRFPMDLYRNDPWYVPPLVSDEKGTLSPGSPGQDACDSRLFLAVQDGDVVGRIAAIVNHTANRHFNSCNLRFGWFDCVNDQQVAQALLESAADFGREMGMKTISGPSGYSRFDKKGLLVEGFEHRPTIATLYNYPYYAELLDRSGFEKQMDMIEHFICDLRQLPSRFVRLAETFRKRSSYRLMDMASVKNELKKKNDLMDLMEAVLSEHYDSFPMTPKQRDFCARKFLPFLNPKLTKIAQNSNNEMVGFFIAMPNLSRGFQKAQGRLFPFGFSYIWRDMRRGNTLLDFCVGGVKKECRNRGLDVLMGVDLFAAAINMGFQSAESNPQLENNSAVLREWRDLQYVQRRRRRVYAKTID